ncbi:glutamate-5-semialdehyde dehydrogenase [Bacillus sp. FSL W8-0920]|uniref:glutamate-5-semialdehyde dehydrogenase n=1 Tax=Bacillus TaxID=1386 RepID=UPI001B83231D|nr:glutamate-5-semialdehyde dehydrogenase [Bacillus pumilus]MBR0590602.1 glutamate-5-semialdehyde dehydrogenase [Bacillus pumilus sxm20-2]MCY7433909.1 glutamate-5-semialdehyde dehydrogenase [Bacillus pumilus]MED1526532.1 glutamate-5-semialdehyde dehydrogenase [Bacillus pumilus]
MTLTAEVVTSVKEKAKKAKHVSKKLGLLHTEDKNEALLKLAEALEQNSTFILQENQKDIDAGKEKGFSEALLDRLMLNEERIHEFAESLRLVTRLTDPVGEILDEWTLENGLHVKSRRVPLGVIGMIYEARPNVTVDAAGLALKAGNAVILKGGSSAISSNKAIVSVIHEALDQTKIPRDAVQLIEQTDRSSVQAMLHLKEWIDVLIPRGGASLIKTVVEQSTIPVLETGTGNCHVFIDQTANVKKAIEIVINAKTNRPAVCNALETLIIHRDWLKENAASLNEALLEHHVTVHGDEEALSHFSNAIPAEEVDWTDEYLSLDLAVKVVDSIEEAIHHIEEYGTKHSEAIVTEDEEQALKFLNEVDAAAVYHNASTRFTDGGALGYGAEIGISTQKLHARGPMGLPALTTTKLLLSGDGQIRS